MKTLSIRTDDTTEYLVTSSILVMAVFIDSILFTQVLTEFTAVTASYPTITNPVLIAFLKSRLALSITCGKCGIEVREDVYVSYSGFCPDCLYKVNVGNNS